MPTDTPDTLLLDIPQFTHSHQVIGGGNTSFNVHFFFQVMFLNTMYLGTRRLGAGVGGGSTPLNIYEPRERMGFLSREIQHNVHVYEMAIIF